MYYWRLRTPQSVPRSILICLVTVSLCDPPRAVTQEPLPDQPFQIIAAPNVDENLFALRVLASTYASWPDKTKSAEEVSTWLTNTRSFVSGMRGQIRGKRLDADLDLAYQSCVHS